MIQQLGLGVGCDRQGRQGPRVESKSSAGQRLGRGCDGTCLLCCKHFGRRMAGRKVKLSWVTRDTAGNLCIRPHPGPSPRKRHLCTHLSSTLRGAGACANLDRKPSCGVCPACSLPQACTAGNRSSVLWGWELASHVTL